MAEYQCKKGCTDCCPKLDNKIVAPVTLGDAYRTFIAQSGNDKTFSQVCRESFDVYALNAEIQLRNLQNRKRQDLLPITCRRPQYF